MPIQFICPNGHPLSAPRKQAGKPGRCPRCDVDYVTPENDQEVVSGDQVQESDPEAGSGTFEFLCPNGHRITTPGSLAGKPGKCPQCGATFRIPLDTPGIQPEGEGGSDDAVVDDAVVDDAVVDDAVEEVPLVHVQPGLSIPSLLLNGEQRMADVMNWIWEEKKPEHQVEISLRDGGEVRPDFYASSISSEEVGMFATRDQEDSFTLIAIAWDSISVVRVAGLPELLQDLFDG